MYAMIPTLVRPKFLAMRNRWRAGLQLKSHRSRDTVVSVFGLLVMYMMFEGTRRTLFKMAEFSSLIYLPPLYPFSFMLMMLLVMLLFSNSASAFGAFFLSNDLDLVLAAPLSNERFFSGKYLQVFLTTAWMPLTFLVPVILAFGLGYNASASYYLLAFALLIPYFMITTSIGIAAATVFVVVVPHSRFREAALLMVCLLLVGIYFLVRLAGSGAQGTSTDMSTLFSMLAVLSLPQTLWLPSHWVASTLHEILQPSGTSVVPQLILLYGCAAGSTAAAYLCMGTLHEKGYSAVRTQHCAPRRLQRSTWEWIHSPPFLNHLHRRYWAVMRKELTLFSREITQTVQFLVLLGLYAIYVYKLGVFGAVQSLPAESRVWWQGLLFTSNTAIGAFVTTAMCTRFVFPSVSLEGQSFWTLLSAPLRVQDIIRAKFICWFIPIAMVAALIFAAGANAVGASRLIILLNALSGVVMSFGIVGLGIGMGAYFADFEWEHPSQLAASFGSLVFMLSSTMLIAVTMVPVGLIIFSRGPGAPGSTLSPAMWWVFIAANVLFIISSNYAAGAWALRAGRDSLLSRMRSA